jgi:hypothetical protein
VPLRRPLALLYRQSGEARSAAPAAVRAADGRPVPIAPRLQIALHLSFAFNEQRLEFPVPAAPNVAALAMPAAAASPTERRDGRASTSERLILAACLRRLEPVCRRLGEARVGWQPLFHHAGRRANAAQASGHQSIVQTWSIDPRIAILSGGGRGQQSADLVAPASGQEGLVCTRPIDRRIALLSGASRGHRSADRTAQAGAAPPWPLREEAAAWAAYLPTPPPDRGNDLFTRLAGRPDAAAAGVSTRHASGFAAAHPKPIGAARQGAGGQVVHPARLALAQAAPPGVPNAAAAGASEAAPAGHLPRGSGARFSRLVQPPQPSGTGVERLTRERNVMLPGTSVFLASTSGSPSARAGGASRVPHRERLTFGQAARRSAPNATADRASPAAPAGRPPRESGIRFARLARSRPVGSAGLARRARERRVTLPGASVSPSLAGGSPAARGGAAPLYLAERARGRTVAPEPFGSVWAPPPLDFRSAAPTPAPPPPQEARPAAAMAPSAAPVDLGAVSRDVISRIEKRLRVERERRGRS